MDWPKAKTILIVCFLALNIFMSYELYIQPVFLGTSDNLSPGRFDSIMNVLKQNGFDIQAQVPRSTPQKGFFRVAVHPYSTGEIWALRDMLLGRTATLIAEADRAVTYMLNSEELVVTSLGSVSYYNRGIFTDSGPLSPEEARQVADKFVLERLGGPQDFVYDSLSYIDPMGYRVQYVQIHEDISIYPAYIMVLVNPSGVVAAWMSRLQVIDTEGSLKTIRSAAEALLSLLSHRLTAGETAGLSVLDMELGYHSRIYDTLEPWPAAPVWRIRTDKGDFYINALSGVVED